MRSDCIADCLQTNRITVFIKNTIDMFFVNIDMV